MYLNQMSAQQAQEQENRLSDPMVLAGLQAQSQATSQQSLYNSASNGDLNGSMDGSMHHGHAHKPSANGYLSVAGSGPGHHSTASTSNLSVPRAQHSRAVSLPSFSQEPFGPVSGQPGHIRSGAHQPQASFSSFSGLGGLNHSGFGLAIQNENSLPGWAEEEIGAK
jgi:hypothetical protein